MDIIIRQAEEADKPAIFDLLKMANMHYIPSPEMPEITYETYVVACADTRIAGFCGYKILSPTDAKTELMVVDPAFRGYGIGLKLQVYRMKEMYKKGIVSLVTNTDLPETIQWYKQHFGYKEIGTLEKLHEFGDPSIDYWTTLQVNLPQWAETY